jgi:cellulose biosynthesis protein BcsQ
VFKTEILVNIRLAEAPGYRKPITHYDPESPRTKAYRELADEVLERLKG